MNVASVVVTAIVIVLTGSVLLVGLAVGARRLLGLQLGVVRTVLAGVVGSAAWLAFGLAIARPQQRPFMLTTVQLGIALLVAMGFLVLAEAVLPSGSLRPVTWARALRHRLARARRYLQISRIAARHGLLPYLRGRRRLQADTPAGRAGLARSVRLALEGGGVSFVKLGQLLANRRDLLPAEFVNELSRLHHQVTPAPWPQVEQVLGQELGTPDAVFDKLDARPLAAASIAQVHQARLRSSGAEVVVKVQRPGIRPVVERDLDIVDRMARRLQTRTRWGATIGAVELARGFANALHEELDFRVEARNTAVVAAASAAPGTDTSVRLPAVHPQLCTERVLVMERLDGLPLDAAGPVIDTRGLDRQVLARALLGCLLRQIMLGGVFHADPHPGNILLLDDGRLGLLDFGSVGRLDALLRAALQQFLLAIDRGDPAGLYDALLEVMVRPDDLDEQRLQRALGQFMARHLNPGAAPEVEMFTDLFRLVASYQLMVPPEVAAVFRALATLEATLGRLAPGFDIVAESRTFAAAQLSGQLQPTSLRQAANDELPTLLPMLRRLPRRADRITNALEHGRLGLGVRLFADPRDRRFLTTLVSQILLAFLGATTGIMAVLLLGSSGGPKLSPTVSLFQVLGYNLLLVSAVLILRVLVTIFRPPR
ncbi:MAG TPA: AarF/UbiB family protein [Actinomycetes bacterium]|nr:AarF/UbiB family protein [Actinomycetes bacterium]